MKQSKKEILRLAFSNVDVGLDKLYNIIHSQNPDSFKLLAKEICDSCIESLGFISDTLNSDDEEK